MTDIETLLGLILKLFPVVALGIYLGRLETRLDGLEKRLEDFINE